MILSNLTFCVSKSDEETFEHFIKIETENILINNHHILKIDKYRLNTIIDPNTANFSLQFFFNGTTELEIFNKLTLFEIINIFDKKYLGKYVYFQSELIAI